MRDNLIQYVNLLFAGTPGSEEIRDEILQNTLDRYDDLIAQGKNPQAAYSLAIAGIGDISEILGSGLRTKQSDEPVFRPVPEGTDRADSLKNRAAAIAMYIMCPIPSIILSEFNADNIGLCLTLLLVAAATVLLILSSRKEQENTMETSGNAEKTHKQKITSIIRPLSLVIFLVISFITGAWYITWIIFPIAGCVRGLVYAILDLMEVNDYET